MDPTDCFVVGVKKRPSFDEEDPMPVSIPVGLPFRVLVVFFASSLAMSAYGAQPPAAPQKVASTIPVWEFRGLRPGSTTETALVADSQWGQPVLRTAHANALEVLYYKVARYGVDVSIRGGIVQSIDIALPAETSLDEVIRAFNLKDPLSDRPLPRSAAVGPSLPEGLEARQFACGRLVVFVSPNDGKPVARVIRFYGPDAVVEHPYLAVLRLRGYGALLEDFQYLGELSGSARFAGDIRKSFRDSQLAQGSSSPEDATRPCDRRNPPRYRGAGTDRFRSHLRYWLAAAERWTGRAFLE